VSFIQAFHPNGDSFEELAMQKTKRFII